MKIRFLKIASFEDVMSGMNTNADTVNAEESTESNDPGMKEEILKLLIKLLGGDSGANIDYEELSALLSQ